jgi:DNA repair protein RadC
MAIVTQPNLPTTSFRNSRMHRHYGLFSRVLFNVTDSLPAIEKIFPRTFQAASPGQGSSSLASVFVRQCLRIAARELTFSSMDLYGGTIVGIVASNIDNPLERVKHLGVHSSGLFDLCAVGFSRREADAKDGSDMGRRIATRVATIMEAGDFAFDILRDECGLEGFEVLKCLSLIEIGRKSALAGKGDASEIEGPRDILELLNISPSEKREHFYAILLNSANVVMRKALIHIGTLTMSIVGPREIFREAVREGASSIIVAHNHPSGDPTPSPEDIEVTKLLVEAGKMLDIPVLDHIIVGHRGDYRSLSEMGLM